MVGMYWYDYFLVFPRKEGPYQFHKAFLYHGVCVHATTQWKNYIFQMRYKYCAQTLPFLVGATGY